MVSLSSAGSIDVVPVYRGVRQRQVVVSFAAEPSAQTTVYTIILR